MFEIRTIRASGLKLGQLMGIMSRVTTADLYTYNLKRDPLEIQHSNFENSTLGLFESVHER